MDINTMINIYYTALTDTLEETSQEKAVGHLSDKKRDLEKELYETEGI